MKQIVFITTHNWQTKRLGGFHKFAEASATKGMETIFFSFPRPYYGYFMKREQLNSSVIKELKKGKNYDLETGGSVFNVTFPTFRLPDGCGKILPSFLMNFLLKLSLGSFKRFAKKHFSQAECFVFESCEGVIFVDKIKKLFPCAKIIYRPSDPMVYASVPERVKKMEQNILLKADINLIVNQEGLDAYRTQIPEFDSKVKFKLLSNGIDLDSYKKEYPVPEELKCGNTILYVGAWGVEWSLLFKAAQETPEYNYVIVCPNYPPEKVIQQVKNYKNITYVPGISPSEVAAWITNCQVVMVPYETDFYKDRPLGITAKYYQAMAAKKPIVAYHDTPKLLDAGVAVTYSYEDFISAVKDGMNNPTKEYNFDLKGREWKTVTDAFIQEVCILQNNKNGGEL